MLPRRLIAIGIIALVVSGGVSFGLLIVPHPVVVTLLKLGTVIRLSEWNGSYYHHFTLPSRSQVTGAWVANGNIFTSIYDGWVNSSNPPIFFELHNGNHPTSNGTFGGPYFSFNKGEYTLIFSGSVNYTVLITSPIRFEYYQTY
jgi:hypothetical protein